MEGNGRGLISSYCPNFCLEVLRKNTKNCEDNRFSGWDLIPLLQEYEASALTVRPQRSVILYLWWTLRQVEDFSLRTSVIPPYAIGTYLSNTIPRLCDSPQSRSTASVFRIYHLAGL
jgi:hypothetical protein